MASIWTVDPGGRFPAVVPPGVPPIGELMVIGSRGWCRDQLSPQVFPRVASLWFNGFSIQAVENIRDPPTQAVENITPLQKAPDMLRSWAAADTELTSPAKCMPAAESKFHALPKNGAVGGQFATV